MSDSETINSITGEHKCAMIFGRLPPEIKKTQAKLFNEGHYKYLVATDAVGMGLNLNIRRIIFSAIYKSDMDGNMDILTEPHMRQIAGRAGRLEAEGGFVLAMNTSSAKIIKKRLEGVNNQYEKPSKEGKLSLKIEQTIEEEAPLEEEEMSETLDIPEVLLGKNDAASEQQRPSITFTKAQTEIKRAIIMPSFQHIDEFSNNLKILTGGEMPFSEIIRKLDSIAKVGGLYTIENYEPLCEVDLLVIEVSELLQDIKLTLYERYTFCMCPLMFKMSLLKQYNSTKVSNIEDLPLNLRKFREWVENYSMYGEVACGIEVDTLYDMIRNLTPEESLNLMQKIYNCSRSLNQCVMCTCG